MSFTPDYVLDLQLRPLPVRLASYPQALGGGMARGGGEKRTRLPPTGANFSPAFCCEFVVSQIK